MSIRLEIVNLVLLKAPDYVRDKLNRNPQLMEKVQMGIFEELIQCEEDYPSPETDADIVVDRLWDRMLSETFKYYL